MRPILFLSNSLCLVLLLASCSSMSSEVSRSRDVESTFMTPWKSNWRTDLSEPLQAVPAKEGGVAVIARRGSRNLQIQHFSSMLGPVRDISVELEPDEEQPRLIRYGDRLFLFTATELDKDRIRIGLRTIDGGATTHSPLQEILVSPEDFERERFIYRYSPDSSRLLVLAFGEEFDLEDDSGEDHPHYAIAGAVIDLAGLGVHPWIDSIRYDDEKDDAIWRDVVVSNEGEPTIVEIVELEEENYQFRVIAQRAGKTQIALHNYPRREPKAGDDPLTPSQIRAGVLSNGDIIAVARNTDGKRLHSLERIRVNRSTLNADFKMLNRFDEAFVKRLTADDDDELLRSHGLEHLLVLEDDSYVPVLQRWYETSSTGSKGETRYKWHYRTVAVFYFNAGDSLMMASAIDRDESWSLTLLAFFEADFALHRDGTRLFFLTRERRKDGVMLYGIDLADPDKPATAKLVAGLGNMAYFGWRYATWSDTGNLFLFMKGGQFGDDWQLMRVTP